MVRRQRIPGLDGHSNEQEIMKIDKIIISTNDSLDYIQFLPIICKAWKKLLGDQVSIVLGYATNKPESQWEWMREYAEVTRFWNPHIPSANLAKVSRLLLASEFYDKNCLLSDIDMLPMQAKYFSDISDLLEPGNIIFYSSDAYPWQGDRYPICYILANGYTYREIVNPQDLSTEELLDIWSCKHVDGKDDVSKSPFSDESLLRWMLIRWGQKNRMNLRRRGWINNIALGRVDRSRWYINPEALHNGEYIDAHLLRPMSQYQDQIRPLTDYLGI